MECWQRKANRVRPYSGCPELIFQGKGGLHGCECIRFIDNNNNNNTDAPYEYGQNARERVASTLLYFEALLFQLGRRQEQLAEQVEMMLATYSSRGRKERFALIILVYHWFLLRHLASLRFSLSNRLRRMGDGG
jgi:hypothetical protein